MRKWITAILTLSLLGILFSGCSRGPAEGPEFVDQGSDRSSFIEQKDKDKGETNLPDAGPIDSKELEKIMQDAQSQKEQNESRGADISKDVDNFSPNSLDDKGTEVTVPSHSGITLPENWQTPTVPQEETGPSMDDVNGVFDDASSSSSSNSSSQMQEATNG